MPLERAKHFQKRLQIFWGQGRKGNGNIEKKKKKYRRIKKIKDQRHRKIVSMSSAYACQVRTYL